MGSHRITTPTIWLSPDLPTGDFPIVGDTSGTLDGNEDKSPDYRLFPHSASPESHTASFASTVVENDSPEVSFSEHGSTLVSGDAAMSNVGISKKEAAPGFYTTSDK